MMTSKTQEALVAGQFGPRAAAYVSSAVHARGEDLLQLVEMVKGRSGARVLDLGCGGGHVSFNVAPEVGEVVAYDLSEEMLAAVAAEARRRGLANIRIERGAVEQLPFPDQSFDVVATRYSAHHWGDLQAALREARRVLKPGGRAVFMDSITPGRPLLDTFLQSIELLRDPSHVRNYSRAEWQQAVVDAGFELGGLTQRRLPLAFGAWVERMGTPELHVRAIRSLQARMSAEVTAHFEIREDGSFTLDTMALEARRA
jgi:SAM-dependent methyltransferase